MSDFIFKIDHQVAELFHKIYSIGGEFANFCMKGISYIAEAGILFLLVGLGLALFKRTRKIGGTILLAVALGFVFTNIILKNAIGRARPFENVSSDFYKWWLDAGANFESGHSFPSGHTTATTAFAVAIFLTTNKKYSWPILLLPIAMASSRIYLMVHYFTDCLGGLVVGAVVTIISYLIVKFIYASKFKFFVWLREFDLFRPKDTKASNPVANTQSNNTTEKVEEFIYVPQSQETSGENPTSNAGNLDDKNNE
ncbi:MAG: phosphatase PAP2 family protein [Clostridia bacterium]|nr:phosphatase PAP2 family protein [Clostridia bacterium]